MSGIRYILHDDDTGGIKCKDGAYRTMVLFGTPRWTCKFWKRRIWADKAALRDGLTSYNITTLFPGDEISADGTVRRACAKR